MGSRSSPELPVESKSSDRKRKSFVLDAFELDRPTAGPAGRSEKGSLSPTLVKSKTSCSSSRLSGLGGGFDGTGALVETDAFGRALGGGAAGGLEQRSITSTVIVAGARLLWGKTLN